MARNIQREFVKYYKERLASLGFIKVKGRQPYFVRVINDEIFVFGLDKKVDKGCKHMRITPSTVGQEERRR